MEGVGKFLGALTGGTNPKIIIHVDPPQNGDKPPVPLDHYPHWKLHKNPFWRVQHPVGSQLQAVPQRALPPAQPPAQQTPQQQQHIPYKNHSIQASPPALVPEQPSSSSSSSSSIIYVYQAEQDISGTVLLRLPPGTNVLEHLGIRVKFLGRIDMSMGIHEGKPHYDFVSIAKELVPPGALYQPETALQFRFKNIIDSDLETYRGKNVAVRYMVQVEMERKFLPPLTYEHDLVVQSLAQEPSEQQAIKMEVGIEECLHIEFEYDRRHYHLTDTILGKIHFLLVRIKIKHMELALIRKEISGEGVAHTAGNNDHDAGNVVTETQTLLKYEIMDGAPVKGEVIPVKLSLQGVPADLTPTYSAVNNRFSVRYFINLVLVDEDDRRYFKQQEIILWRKDLG